jgi:hypothetical protein
MFCPAKQSPKIYDLNNVPLVSGVSLIKWHLPHSIRGEHRGRTGKRPIAKNRVEYNYAKVVPVRIAIDRNGNLSDCQIEFEVVQEFSMAGAAAGGGGYRDEKITLGTVQLNLSEYVEESEAILREDGSVARSSVSGPSGRSEEKGYGAKRSSVGLGGQAEPVSPKNTAAGRAGEPAANESSDDAEEGVVRRYLMQESKINSTLKIGILMVQIDGERGFAAPTLKTAPVFGGIAGIMQSEPLDQDGSGRDGGGGTSLPPALSKSRETSELQDMYRRALAASWACPHGELPADECIEDIFAGGDGFGTAAHHRRAGHARPRTHLSAEDTITARGSASGDGQGRRRAGGSHDSGSTSADDEGDAMGTLRPNDLARLQQHYRTHSNSSDKSVGTVVDPRADARGKPSAGRPGHGHHRRQGSKDDTTSGDGSFSRSESLPSLGTALGSDRGRDGFKRVREVRESDAREDLVAWSISGVAS